MTEELAEAAMRAVTAQMGPGWRIVRDKDILGFYMALEYGKSITFCRGRTWAGAVDSFAEGCRLGGLLADCVPERYAAGSAKELVLKLAADGLLQETPGKAAL